MKTAEYKSRKVNTKRELDELLRSQLIQARQSYIPRWEEIIEYIMPEDGEFMVPLYEDGSRKDTQIWDITASLVLRTAENGMMSSITSPALKWFVLGVKGMTQDEYGDPRTWVSQLQDDMYQIIADSNAYKCFLQLYRQYIGIGTAAMMVEEDTEEVIRCHVFPVGSYMIAQNHKGQVDTFARDFVMTVRQAVMQFGKFDDIGMLTNPENFSASTLEAFETGKGVENRIQIFHIVKPNPAYNANSIFAKEQMYSSCYYERGSMGSGYSSVGDDTYLSESGYDYFPVLCPRWQVSGSKAYGINCPGMLMIGDTKQLQAEVLKASLAVDKLVDPPVIIDSSLKQNKHPTLPGKLNWTDNREAQAKPIYQVDPKLVEQDHIMESTRSRIRKSGYEDLFLMFSTSDRREFTATEVHERREEKMVGLGSPLQNLNKDFLKPFIEILYRIMLKQGLVAKPPEDVAGAEIQITYVSAVAQAQRAVGLGAMDRFYAFAERVFQVDPGAMVKVNSQQALDVYASRTDIQPGVIRSDDEVAELQAAQANAQKQQEKMQMLPELAKTAKTLSETDVTKRSALTDVAAAMEKQGADIMGGMGG